MTAVFPSFVGLSWDRRKRPVFSTRIQRSSSGREVRAGLFAAPLWEFDLSYEVLRADLANVELQALLGFYLQQGGPLTGFYFSDWSDNTVTGQGIATGDGATRVFPLIRTLGGYVEPVGGLDTATSSPAVFVNGTLQTSGVSWQPTTVSFAAAPASGALITASFSFYYLVRFSDDTVEFNNFMVQLWEVQKLTLKSYRP